MQLWSLKIGQKSRTHKGALKTNNREEATKRQRKVELTRCSAGEHRSPFWQLLQLGSGVRWKCGCCVQCSAPPTSTQRFAWHRGSHRIRLAFKRCRSTEVFLQFDSMGSFEGKKTCSCTCRSGSPVFCGWCQGQWGKPPQCSTEGSPAGLLVMQKPWLPLQNTQESKVRADRAKLEEITG